MELLEILAGLLLEALGIWAEIADDRQNRNDRGKLKRPSSKYVV